MQSELVLEENVARLLDALSEQKPIQMQKNTEGVYEPAKFEENPLDLRSSTSIVGESVGGGLAGTVYGLVSGFLPGMAAMSPGLVTAAAGWAIGKYIAKNGFGHAVARGVMVAGVTTFVAPMVAGIAGALGQGGQQ